MSLLAAHGGLIAAGGVEIDPLAVSIYAKLTSWWEMDESSGIRADSKGSNPMSTTGTVSTATGLRGGADVAAAFAGTGALTANDSPELSVPAGGGDHCLFGWGYFNANTGTQMLAAKWNASGAATLEYAIQQSGGTLYGQNGGSGYRNAALAVGSAAAWHFYVLWRDSTADADSGKVRLQMDDGSVALSPAASNPSDTAHQLGFAQAGSSASARLSGRLQRWGWIKGAILTPEERSYLYNSGAGRTWAELAAAAGE